MITFLLWAWAIVSTVAGGLLWLDRNMYRDELHRICGELAKNRKALEK